MNKFNTIWTSICVIVAITSMSFTWVEDGILQGSYSLTVQVKGLESSKGKVIVGLFRESDEFMEETFRHEITSEISNGSAQVVFKNLPYQDYAVSVYHDENINDTLDKNFVGLPTEGYGFSNDAMGLMGPPDFEDCTVDIKKTPVITINLR